MFYKEIVLAWNIRIDLSFAEYVIKQLFLIRVLHSFTSPCV